MTTRKNKHVGGDWNEFVRQEKANDPEFARAYQIEFDRLQLARRVKFLREKHRLTQEQLAELVGTKQPAIARLEAGTVLPRLDLLEKIAYALDARLDVKFIAERV